MGNYCPYLYSEDYLAESFNESDLTNNLKANIDYFNKERQLLEKGLNKLITPNETIDDKPNQYEKWSKADIDNRLKVVNNILHGLRVIYTVILEKRVIIKFYLNIKKSFYIKKDDKDKLIREVKKLLVYINTLE